MNKKIIKKILAYTICILLNMPLLYVGYDSAFDKEGQHIIYHDYSSNKYEYRYSTSCVILYIYMSVAGIYIVLRAYEKKDDKDWQK